MYKLFLAHKNNFSFTNKKTGNKVYCGLILMHKMLDVCKPETIKEVCHLKKDLDTVGIWPMLKNNVCLLTTPVMTVLQEIHAKTGKDSYTNQRFITNLFRALETSSTKEILAFLDQLKCQWIMEDILEPAEIIQELAKMHHNMVADSSWLNKNEKDTKIVDLTLAIQEVNKNFSDLAKKVSFDDSPKGGSSGKKGSSKSPNKRDTKACCPKWQVTKKGNTLEHEDCKYVWCPKHTSKDGSVKGFYMPSPHNHEEWAKSKADKTAAFKKRKEEAKKSGKSESTKKVKPNNTLKLALGNKLAAACVTQHHMMQTEAESLFNLVYKEFIEDN
jgi:hypothetical protein